MKKQPVIIHSFPSWDAPYIKSTIELIKEVNNDYDWYFIDYAYTLKDLIFNRSAPFKNIVGFNKRIRNFINKKGVSIKIVSLPPILPFNSVPRYFKPFIERVNLFILERYLTKFRSRFNKQRPIVINALNPYYGLKLKDTLDARKTLYYCYDNIDAMPWASTTYSDSEKEFCNHADHVLTTSKGLLAKLSPNSRSISEINNGVNNNVFYQREKTITDTVFIDYIGSLDDRLDVELLSKMINSFPEYRFRFFGKVNERSVFNQIEHNSNVKNYGQIDQRQLAELLSNSAVCIIPFIKNDFTKYIYPLKINEYLSLGKPVVSTRFADLSDFEEIISIGNTHSQFIDCLKNELSSNSKEKIDARVAYAKRNNWASRAAQLCDLLSQDAA